MGELGKERERRHEELDRPLRREIEETPSPESPSTPVMPDSPEGEPAEKEKEAPGVPA